MIKITDLLRKLTIFFCIENCFVVDHAPIFQITVSALLYLMHLASSKVYFVEKNTMEMFKLYMMLRSAMTVVCRRELRIIS